VAKPKTAENGTGKLQPWLTGMQAITLLATGDVRLALAALDWGMLIPSTEREKILGSPREWGGFGLDYLAMLIGDSNRRKIEEAIHALVTGAREGRVCTVDNGEVIPDNKWSVHTLTEALPLEEVGILRMVPLRLLTDVGDLGRHCAPLFRRDDVLALAQLADTASALASGKRVEDRPFKVGNKEINDDAVVAAVVKDLREGKAKSFLEAATARQGDITGHGSLDSKIKRIAKKAATAYKKAHKERDAS